MNEAKSQLFWAKMFFFAYLKSRDNLNEFEYNKFFPL